VNVENIAKAPNDKIRAIDNVSDDIINMLVIKILNIKLSPHIIISNVNKNKHSLILFILSSLVISFFIL